MIVPKEWEEDIRREIKELMEKGYKQYHFTLDIKKIFGDKNARTKPSADKA